MKEKMDEPIQLQTSAAEIITMLEKTERIFAVHLKGTNRPDARMLILDDGDDAPYTVLLAEECWEKVQTKRVLEKCTFGSKPGEIKKICDGVSELIEPNEENKTR